MKEQVNDLKRDMKIVYQTTKQFVKEHARDLKAFKSAFKGLSDKIHEKTQKTAERGSNEPRTNEFIQEHRKSLRKNGSGMKDKFYYPMQNDD